MSVGFLTPDARLRVFADVGTVLAGAKLHTYIAGTPSTPLATFSDSALTVPNLNPVVASAGGLFGPIYLTPGSAYKLALTDSSDVAIWTQDNVLIPVVLTAPITVPQGGTGLVTLTAHGVLIGEGVANAAVTAAGTAGQVLTSGGAAADPTFQTLTSLVLDKSTTEQDVVNTVAATDVYSVAVPGGTLGTGKALRLTLDASYLNNSGAPVNLGVSVTFGGVVIGAFNNGPAANAARTVQRLDVLINANGATNSQRASLLYDYGAPAADGTMVTTGLRLGGVHGALTLDDTVAQTLKVTITHGAAALTVSFRRYAALLELLG